MAGSFDDEEFETDPEEIRERQAAHKQRLAQASRCLASAQHSADSAPASSTEKKPSARRGLSLKMRAIQFLSRREHSRLELSRKLAAHAESAEELQQLLDWLEHEKWLSTERFAHSLINRRAHKVGNAVILQELRQHGVTAEQTELIREELRETEFDRAREVWHKKFQSAPQDAKAYAKQYRFMASRGFSSRILQQILGSLDDDGHID